MKINHSIIYRLALLALLSAINSQLSTAYAQGTTAFTYQGQLHDYGTNANGAYTMIFKLYDAVSGGNQIGSTITTSPTLVNGLYSVNLDFGAGAFDGTTRWLDITVQSGADIETLAPRVQVLPAPYALYSSTAGSAVNLSSGTWNVAVGNYQSRSNVMGIFDNGALVLGMSTSGSYFSGTLGVNGGLQADGFYLDGGGSISDDGGGGVEINGNASVSAGGSISCASISAGGYGNISCTGIDCSGNIHCANLYGGNISCTGIDCSGDIHCRNLYGNVNPPSDRNLKEKFEPIDAVQVLECVTRLPISTWNFKTDKTTRHLGPMAQDFYAAFNVGPDDKHIATIDEGGVALAAIQGLNEKLKEKDARIEALEKRLADLEQLVKTSTQK